MTKQEAKDLAQVFGAAIILTAVVWVWQDIKKSEAEKKKMAAQHTSVTQKISGAVQQQKTMERE